ncbi:MAG: 6-phosphogluconolactonase [Acidimicrobiales bacterium]
MELVVAATPRAAARAFAGWFTVVARRAMGRRGVCTLAMSGGATAGVLFEALIDTEVFWGRVELFQVDERVAPEGDAARNATALVHDFAEQAGIPDSRVHLMDVTAADLEAAAARYAAAVPQRFDVVHLGLGADGHTASWPPVTRPRWRAGRRWPSPPFNGHVRMTLTPTVVNAAEHRAFVVAGAAKSAALAALRAGEPGLPAVNVQAAGTTIYADRAAAGESDG